MKELRTLQKATWDYYKEHGRHDLPWRQDTSPYSIVVSEIMLQQTQVGRAREKYVEFTAALPSFEALAHSPQSEVLRLWQGLGYNRRALWLKAIADLVAREYGTELPLDQAELQKLPGIGPNTAGSIAAFAFDMPVVFIETNIRRVFIHHCFADQADVSDKEILPLIEQALDKTKPREWYWALMDYGSYLATVEQLENPNRRSKHYTKQTKFAGSDRQIRGEVLRLLLNQSLPKQDLLAALTPYETDHVRIDTILAGLVKDGFIIFQKDLCKLV